jgi:hypothetical protein
MWTNKRKMMVFNKRKRKSEESEWKREESMIERESEFKYLGYTFNERATDKAHVRGSEKGEQGSWMCLGNRREKVGR